MEKFDFTAWDNGLFRMFIRPQCCLIIMVGLPGSGKSTFAKEIVDRCINEYKIPRNMITYLSSDEIRKQMFGCYRKEDTPSVFNEMNKLTAEALKRGDIVIYDATNISRKKRVNFIKEMRYVVEKMNNGYIDRYLRVCTIFMATPYKECLERNANRENVVPEEYINMMYKTIQIPDMFEGTDFSFIHYSKNAEIIPFSSLWSNKEGFMNMPQDNPHHKLTLGQHCLKCGDALKDYSMVLREAGYLHDIGKMYTKTFTNYRGIKTDIAHYYGHENVSAYESLFYESIFMNKYNQIPIYSVINDIYERAILIKFHMLPYFMESEKMKQKYGFTEKIKDDIMVLHKADMMAH